MENKDLRKKILEFAYVQGFLKNGKNIETNLKVKKSTVEYVLAKLQSEGYFSKVRYEINFEAIGIGKFAWIFVSVNWEKFNFQAFIEKALNMPQISVIADMTGEYDLALKIFGPSIQSINSFVLGFEKIFENTIIDTKIYFANTEYKRHYMEIKKINQLKLSKIDYQILCEKNNNPDLSIIEIADKLKIHRNTVSTKWHNYWNSQLLLKKTIELTPKGCGSIGLGLKAFIILRACPGTEEKIVKSLINENKIQDLFTTLSNEIIVLVRVANSEDLAYFYKTLSKINTSVKSTNTIIFLTKHTKTGITLEELSKIITLI